MNYPTRGIGLVTLDFETYYADDYTLSKMTTEAYIRDPRFEVIGVGVKVGEVEKWMTADEFHDWAPRLRGMAVLAHHAHFDGLILNHHFGVKPAFWFDTLSMARHVHGTEVGNSLKKLAEHYGVGVKGEEVILAKNLRRNQFSAAQWTQYGNYCLNDCRLAEELLWKLSPAFSDTELWCIDATVRMFTEPTVLLDVPKLEAALQSELDKKAALLARAETMKEDLLSNQKFAQLLLDLGVEPPMKTSLKTGKEAFAFAKSDAGFKDLLEHERDEVRWLAEARVGIKSTINETRAARLLGMAKRGPAAIYLKHSGAHTHRWSGGDKSNFQNLRRGGALRGAVTAPDGFVIVACDSSQIEARGLAWLAGDAELLQAFREGRDVYSELASEIYGRHVDRKANKADEIPGFVGKVACIAEGTPILTERAGWVPIETLAADDRVWDGMEWVAHLGLLDQGEREVWESNSAAATPDHEMLTEHGWRAWQEVLTSPSLFQSALSLGTLPSCDGNTAPNTGETQDGSQLSGVPAGTSDPSTVKISNPDELRDVTHAPKLRPPQSDTGFTSTPSQTMSTAPGSSIDWHRASPDVRTQRMPSGNTTAGGASRCASCGGPTERHSCDMFRRLMGGTNQNSRWTAPTTTEGTNLETSDSSPALPTLGTSDRLECSKRRSRVYDISFCGPRSRFVIWSSAGPIIAHNCLGLGYGMGWKKFAGTLLSGGAGQVVQFTADDAASMWVNVPEFKARNAEALETMITRLKPEDLAVHCAVAKSVVDKYRKVRKDIKAFWDTAANAIAWMDEGQVRQFGPGAFWTNRHKLILPSENVLNYPGLRGGDEGYSYLGGRAKTERARLYGGAFTENIVQAFCRDIIAEQMACLYAEHGYRPLTMTHDEVVFLAHEADAEAAQNTVLDVMCTPPEWCKDLPLGAEAGYGKTYEFKKKAKR